MADDLQLPGDYGLPSVSPMYVGGVAVEDAVNLLSTTSVPGQQISGNRFWSSPPRALTYQFSEGIVINLAKKKKINYLALDLPVFPYHAYFHYWDDKAKAWVELKGPSTGSLRIYIDGSIPAVVGSAAAYQSKQHPSHYGAGHWVHYDLDLIPVTTSKLRVMCLRNFGTRKGGPKNPQGRDAKYSVGIRNLDFGWRVRKKQDIPLTLRDPDILTEKQSFTQVLDLFGSPVELKLRENRASDLLRGSIWKCEPQPVPYAVVNFFVDARDPQGESQVIDRFTIAPVTAGANLNLYYSNEVPDTDFGASDAPIVFPALRAAGEAEAKIESSGLLFPDKISYVDLTNQAVQWNPAQPFWLALEFQPQWVSTDVSPHIIFDTGSLQLAWNAGVFRLSYGGGALYQQAFEFSANTRLHAIVSYDGQRLSFYMPESGVVANVPTSMASMVSNTIRLGAEVGPSTAPVIFTGRYRLNAMLIKQEALTFESGPEGLIVPPSVQQFVASPNVYLDKAEYVLDEDGSTDNALLRYLPRYASGATNKHGFVGGTGSIYEDVIWTPITRDYKLRAGTLQFMPVRAKFFKFEFTNLTPEPYQTFQPISRKVKTYGTTAVKRPFNPQSHQETQTTNASPGLTANADAAPAVSQFSDQPVLREPTQADVLPTEALHTTDLGIQDRLDAMGSLYGFQAWRSGTFSPRYPTTSKHIYEEVEVGHAKRIAYFVALSKLEMFRVDYAADDDTEQYVDLFDDVSNVDPEYLTEKLIIGTTNLAVNPSFESGTTGHTLYTSGTATGGAIATVADGKFGPNALKVSATALGAASTDRIGWKGTYTTPIFTASVAYSIYAKRVIGNATLRLHVEYYNAAAAFISSDARTFAPNGVLGDSLITNPFFNTDTSGWEPAGNTTITTSTSIFHEGTRSLRITPGGGQVTVGAGTLMTSKLVVVPGKSYRLEGWLYAAGGHADTKLAIDWYANDLDASFISTVFGTLATLTAAAWSYRSDTITVPAGATRARARVRIGSTPLTTDVIHADEVQLREIVEPWERVSAVMLPPPLTTSAQVHWWLETGNGTAVEYHFDGYQIENLRLTDYSDGVREGVDIRPWAFDGDKLTTAGSLDHPATTMSRRFASKRRVRGVQFASSQSSAVQLVPDPDFTDPDLASWIPDGDVIEMELSDDINSTLGSAVRVLRSSSINTWGELKAAYPTWVQIEASEDTDLLPTYGTLEGDASVIGHGGVRLRNPVQVSEAGRVYAAARVYADTALDAPLVLQILSAAGDVLAEQSQIVQPGKVVEWTVGHTIGETPTIAQTWADIMQRDASPILPTYGNLKVGKWADLTSVQIAQSRNLTVRVIQKGPGSDTWYVDSLALFEDAILWEFSNDDGLTWWPALDIRNDPNGVLIFPNSLSPLPTDPTGLRWRVTGFRPHLHVSSLDIRPWYAETVFGIPRREAGVSGGPNIQPTDHYPPIADDPMFQAWGGPIPQDWYYVFRQLLLLDRQQVPVVPIVKPDTFANPQALLVPVEHIPTPDPFQDLYTGNYTSIYGVPTDLSSGIYEDTYDPLNDF